jgi:hypothetical protein
MPRISRSNQLRKLADNLERIANKPTRGGKRLPLDASCTIHQIKAYCHNREKLWKAAIK